jgi:hypothetical protein
MDFQRKGAGSLETSMLPRLQQQRRFHPNMNFSHSRRPAAFLTLGGTDAP